MARWTALLPSVMLLIGCGRGLRQGDRVVLVAPGQTELWVEDMPAHIPDCREADGSPALTIDVEKFPVGTRATVVTPDAGNGKVRIKLDETPCAGLTGTVKRENIRADR
jgi:hypothetical protein